MSQKVYQKWRHDRIQSLVRTAPADDIKNFVAAKESINMQLLFANNANQTRKISLGH
jgi:hypothetical protein